MPTALGYQEQKVGGTLAAVGSATQGLGRSAFVMSGRLHTLASTLQPGYGYAEHNIGGTLVAFTPPLPPSVTKGWGPTVSFTGWGG